MAQHITAHISKLREDFIKGTLSENDVNPDPFLQFEAWFKQVIEAEVPEPQAMTLSTVENNKPHSRIVYLRELEENKFWFYGNYNSLKAKNMADNPNVCLNFFWPSLERQIRIEGTVTVCDNKYSDNYFNNRPYESKLGAWASDQSSLLTSRQQLEDKLDELRKQYDGKDIQRPPFWGGWILTANYYEFWQGRKSRLHDRICYEMKNNKWNIFRLAP